MGIKTGKMPYPFPPIAQLFKVLLTGVVILSCFFALNHLKLSQYFPIKTVRVYGVNHVDQREMQGLLVPLIDHGFFTVNVEYLRDRLLQMPWVASTVVTRSWPDKIEITVVEKKAIASWNKTSLMSEAGEIFSPDPHSYPTHLPHFLGPEGKQIEVLDYYQKISALIPSLHAQVAYLELTPYLTWKLTLDNGIQIQLGHKDVLTRLSHFVKVYSKIVGSRAGDVEYIDLRYPNGAAVKWKTMV